MIRVSAPRAAIITNDFTEEWYLVKDQYAHVRCASITVDFDTVSSSPSYFLNTYSVYEHDECEKCGAKLPDHLKAAAMIGVLA